MLKKDPDYFMQLAFKESLKGLGRTRPNPIVGAVVVNNGKVISKGYHPKAGLPHAEIYALDKAGAKARGADLYVTLEPCCIIGRTAACTERIIEAGIKRVFIGIKDPNPKVNGRGIAILKRNGIDVKVGFLQKQINDSNRTFNKFITKRLPFITVKIAQSIDGKIATFSGNSKWITSQESRDLAHKMRSGFDASITGINTVIKDNPRFREANLRIVVDSKLKIPVNSRIFESGKIIIATTQLASLDKVVKISKKADIIFCPLEKGRVNLLFLMKELAKRELSSVLVEAGGELTGSFFDAKLVDKVLFFIAEKIIGGKNAISSIEGIGVKKAAQAIKLENVNFKKIGEDSLIEGYVNVHRNY